MCIIYIYIIDRERDSNEDYTGGSEDPCSKSEVLRRLCNTSFDYGLYMVCYLIRSHICCREARYRILKESGPEDHILAFGT